MSTTVIKGRTFTIGLNRIPSPECDQYVAHLYLGDFDNVGHPMCRHGWNRSGGTGFSIWRGHPGRGICKTCRKRAEAGLEPVPPKVNESSDK